MIKKQLTEYLGAKCGITATEAEKFLNTIIYKIYDELRKGEEVNISGFGKFEVHQTKGKIGVNPRKWTEKIVIQPRNTPKFRAGSAFKEAVKLI